MFLFDVDILWIALLAAGLNQLINYAIGKPSSEFSPYEIFTFYTVWLSIRRLKVVGIYDRYSEQYHDNLLRVKTKSEIITLKNDFKKLLYDAADPYFTWERAVGMCPICTGFWVSLVIGLIVNQNFSGIIEIIVISHILIRIINKIL